jgi:hypothetical protein
MNRINLTNRSLENETKLKVISKISIRRLTLNIESYGREREKREIDRKRERERNL